jgi:hypothetical protein
MSKDTIEIRDIRNTSTTHLRFTTQEELEEQRTRSPLVEKYINETWVTDGKEYKDGYKIKINQILDILESNGLLRTK